MAKQAHAKENKATIPVPGKVPLFQMTSTVRYCILALLCFAFYSNTLLNQYALDDLAVIQTNPYVQEGFKGIKKIMTTDAFESFYKQNNSNQQLAGGRYRPLSIVVFAIEHAIFGESVFVMHLVNILFFTACIFSIFYFLSNILLKKIPSGTNIAFLATILFLIHPIHTEVVANIKSLDEILSLFFIMLTFIFSVRYLENKKMKFLAAGMIFYLLALFSKEYPITLLLLLPTLFYLLKLKKLPGAFISSLPYWGVAAVYLLIRFNCTGFPHHNPNEDILNNSYLFATPVQQFATKFWVLGKYLLMLFIPYPLAFDYGYAQIPLYNFSNVFVWIPIFIYGFLIVWAVKLLRNKNILAFPVLFYLLNLALVSNFFFGIGAPMGERLIFHSSFGFTTVLSFGIFKVKNKLTLNQVRIMFILFFILVAVCFWRTVVRNGQWKNNLTLYTRDVNFVPNSVKANENAGVEYLTLAAKAKDSLHSVPLVREGIGYLKKAISIDNRDVNASLNMGIAYCQLVNPDSVKYYWDITRELYPTYPGLKDYYDVLAKIYINKGIEAGKKGNQTEALRNFRNAAISNPDNPDTWVNLGEAYYNVQKFDSARYVWTKALAIKPNYPDVKKWIGMLPGN